VLGGARGPSSAPSASVLPVSERLRVAAVIERDGRILMIRERVQTAPDRHDGPKYWTLPGGGTDPGEDPSVAVARKVAEEVGLRATYVEEVARVPYPSGFTTVFKVDVADGEPRLGNDDLPCLCPRMVGLDWVERPALSPRHGGSPVPLLVYAW